MYGHPSEMRLRRQRGFLSQQRPDQLAFLWGMRRAAREVLGGRARSDGLLDVVAATGRLAGMSAAVVRVDAARASTTNHRAHAPEEVCHGRLIGSLSGARGVQGTGVPYR